MSIRNKLRALLVFMLLACCARLALFGLLNAGEHRAIAAREQAGAIVTSIVQLTILSLDYRVYQEPRPFQLIGKKLAELEAEIATLDAEAPAQVAALGGLQRDLQQLRRTYWALVALHQAREPGGLAADAARPEGVGDTTPRIFRLASLMSAESSDLMAYARRLMDLSQQRAHELASLNRNLSLAFDLLMVLLIFGIVSALRRDLLRALEALRSGTRALAAGDLDARVVARSRDELGELAAAFNHMAGELGQRQRQLEGLHQDLRGVNEMLEQRVAQRTAELTGEAERRQQAILELRRSNEELRQFAYVASHDLQEPLRMVSSYSDLLRRRLGGQVDAEAARYLDYVNEGARRMQGLILALLAYSRVTGRAGTGAPVPLAEPLAEALANLRLLIDESGAAIEHGPLPTLCVDRAQMVQLFQNLIGNALKFRGAEPPRVCISAAPLGDAWRVAVEDNGIGIAPEHHERIFVIFQRLHSRTEIAGTGIGLALCRRICERHGGTLTVESRPGAGATFHITLPDIREPA